MSERATIMSNLQVVIRQQELNVNTWTDHHGNLDYDLFAVFSPILCDLRQIKRYPDSIQSDREEPR